MNYKIATKKVNLVHLNVAFKSNLLNNLENLSFI